MSLPPKVANPFRVRKEEEEDKDKDKNEEDKKKSENIPLSLSQQRRFAASAPKKSPPPFPDVSTDRVRSHYLPTPSHEVTHPQDWRDIPMDTLPGKVWHAVIDEEEILTDPPSPDAHDFGATTDFGFGWGPLEVIRADRFARPDRRIVPEGRRWYRVLHLAHAGRLRLIIHASDNGRVIRVWQVDARGQRQELTLPSSPGGVEPASPPTPPSTPAAACPPNDTFTDTDM